MFFEQHITRTTVLHNCWLQHFFCCYLFRLLYFYLFCFCHAFFTFDNSFLRDQVPATWRFGISVFYLLLLQISENDEATLTACYMLKHVLMFQCFSVSPTFDHFYVLFEQFENMDTTHLPRTPLYPLYLPLSRRSLGNEA